MHKKTRLNILLINPPEKKSYGKFKPPIQLHMGLAYLAAMVEKENVKILDMNESKASVKFYINMIKQERFDIIGFSVATPVFLVSLELAKLAKSYSPDTFVIFGGFHASMRPIEVLSYDCVDLVVRGEGEITFKEIVDRLKHEKDFSDITGIFYRQNGIVRETPLRPLLKDLDILPFPARHFFAGKQYTYPDSLYKNAAPVITSRGCPGVCTFCMSHKVFGRMFRARSTKNVVDEIEFLIKRYRAKEIHVWDDNFATNKTRIFEIKDEVLRRNLKTKFAFPNGIRADFLDKEVIEALRDMGTYSLAIGVESGSQAILNKAGKRIKLEKIIEIFDLAKKLKLETWAFFMIGLIDDNAYTIKQTIDFARKLNPDVAKFHILKPFPGSSVYEYLHSRNFILTKDYDQFGFHTPPIHRLEELTPSQILEWQKKAYASFYLRPQKILQQIKRIRTFHRLKVNFQAASGLIRMILSKN